jgi:hypothetical protein
MRLVWTVRNLGVAAGVVAMLVPAAPALAGGTVEVRLTLPVRARLDMRDVESVALTPFLVIREEGREPLQRQGLDLEAEFSKYLERLIKRNTKLDLIDSGPVDFPVYELSALRREEDFWRALGERLQADLILTGSLDFDVQDRSGYRTEAYTSPYDGRTYYRQVLVEETGFEFDIVMQVYDGRTGELLYNDNFKDFKRFEGERTDPLTGMFENLYALESRIAGIFVQKRVETNRVLFTP